MDDKRCETCGWWMKHQRPTPDNGPWDGCSNPAVGSGGLDGLQVYSDSLPVIVGPAFGCVHYTPKEADGE